MSKRKHMDKVAKLGCAICRRLGLGKTPAEVHHKRTGTGAGKRSSDHDTIPLCPYHHRGQGGIHGMGRKAFEREYGVTEVDLVRETQEAIRCAD